MKRATRRWLTGAAIAGTAAIAGLGVAAYVVGQRLDPYVREQAISYLERRFDSDVEMSSLKVRVSELSPLRILFRRGGGTMARIEGEGLSVRYRGRRDIPPMFVLDRFALEMDVGTIFQPVKIVHLVTIDGMHVTIPPKGERPVVPGEQESAPVNGQAADVVIDEIVLSNSTLTILPRDSAKVPLHFRLHRVTLESAGRASVMTYKAELTNAKPSGEIDASGTFGPWAAAEPGDTPLAGRYVFQNADLSTFSGIVGTLNSTGEFQGTLSAVEARGEASVADFGLKMSGNRVPLQTRFEVLVDGTNGNTVLQPVYGRLGGTEFTTSGGVIKHETDLKHTISLDVLMPKGDLRDVLTLSMKGPPFMEGQVFLKTKIDIPPLTSKVRERLLLRGSFEVTRAKFLRSAIQNKIDELSRRGQGQPGNVEIDEVVSAMAGSFSMVDETITFSPISFAVAGAGIDLSGRYDLSGDTLDFRGTLRLRARISQTMTGWKRWVLKPIDPFFSKQGAGTLLRIRVVGTSKAPQFGRDTS